MKITICLKYSNEIIDRLKVNSTDFVKSIYSSISQKENYLFTHYSLYHCNNILREEKQIKDYDIHEGSMIELEEKTVNICFIFKKQIYNMNVIPSITIYDIKCKLEIMSGYSVNNISFICYGKSLEETKKLSDFGINTGDNINCILREKFFDFFHY